MSFTNFPLPDIQAGAADTITELYGPVLEELAELEHERWMHDREQEGWRPGPLDTEMMTRPEMVPYAELDEPIREQIRLRVRMIPENLRQVGFEIYRKSF